MKMTVDVTSAQIARFWLYVLLGASTVLFALYGSNAVASLSIALFIGVAVGASINFFVPYMPGKSRKLAATSVFLLIAAVVSLVVSLLIPLITTQARELIAKLPELVASFEAGDGALAAIFAQFNLIESLETLLINVVTGLLYSSEATQLVIQSVFSNAINTVLTLIIGFLLAIDGPVIAKKMELLLSDNLRPHIQELARRMYKAVSGFVGGQLIITSIAATLTYLLLLAFDIPSPLSLAAAIWLTGLIPLVGNTLGAVLVILVALSQSFGVAIFLTVYYIVYQQVENNVFEPLIQAHTVHLTPLIVLVSAVIGIHLAGFAGALLAIPAGACVRILVTYMLEQRALADADMAAS